MRVLRLTALFILTLLLLPGTTSTSAQAPIDCPGAPAPRLTVGGEARVSPGQANNVRDMPSTSGARLGQVTAGQSLTVLDGPVCADGYLWWQVQAGDLRGWTVEGEIDGYWLSPLCSAGPGLLAWSMIIPVVAEDNSAQSLSVIMTDVAEAGQPCRLVELSGDALISGGGMSELAWSPDGSRLAFLYNYQPQESLETFDFVVYQYLYVVDADGDNLRRLVEAPGTYESLVWSPDGARLAYLWREAGRDYPQVWRVNADGSNPAALTSSNQQKRNLAWSPDGAALAFTAPGEDGETIYRIGPGGGEAQVISTIPTGGIRSGIQWSSDSSRLLMGLLGLGIASIDVDDGSMRLLKAGEDFGEWVYAAAWSPDETRIAYFRDHGLTYQGSPLDGNQLMLMGAAGEDERVLVEAVFNALGGSGTIAWQPAWSPDGQYLAYADLEGVWVVRVEDGQLLNLADETPARPVWQP